MNKELVCKKILMLLKSVMEDEKLNIEYDEDITKVLNSIGFVTLVVELEDEFDIELDDEDFELSKMGNINRIADLVIKYKTA